MILSKNSWHHRLASYYGPLYKWEMETDVCNYISAVLKGTFMVWLIFGISLFLTLGIGDVLLWLYVGVTIGWTDLGLLGFVVSTFLVCFGIIFGIGIFSVYVSEKELLTKSKVYQVTYAWFHKYCFTISLR